MRRAGRSTTITPLFVAVRRRRLSARNRGTAPTSTVGRLGAGPEHEQGSVSASGANGTSPTLICVNIGYTPGKDAPSSAVAHFYGVQRPMRILLVADIHANWPALQAIQEPHDNSVGLGDLVDS